MTLTIEVSGEMEELLKARAEEEGIPADQAASRLLAKALTPGMDQFHRPARLKTPEERAQAWLEWAESHRHTPPLSDEAISRDTMYPGVG